MRIGWAAGYRLGRWAGTGWAEPGCAWDGLAGLGPGLRPEPGLSRAWLQGWAGPYWGGHNGLGWDGVGRDRMGNQRAGKGRGTGVGRDGMATKAGAVGGDCVPHYERLS